MRNSNLTVIIGKNSNLSKYLYNSIENTVLIETLNLKNNLSSILDNNNKINIIFNNFQSATKLNDMSNPSKYIYRSIQSTADALEIIQSYTNQINKIIYTSSSAVYGNNIYGSESDQPLLLNLHASLKLANEKLIEKFSDDNKIEYIIIRLYNMFGGEDKFSVISKIINNYRDDDVLTIVNNGNAIRDFIHIYDIVKIYSKLLSSKYSGILNIGSGDGNSIKSILDFLFNHNIIIKTDTINRDELKISTSNNELLLELIGKYRFKDVNEYILEQIKKTNSYE